MVAYHTDTSPQSDNLEVIMLRQRIEQLRKTRNVWFTCAWIGAAANLLNAAVRVWQATHHA